MSAIVGSASAQRAHVSEGFTADRAAQQLLTRAVRTWFAVALVGQLIFSTYIVLVYGGAIVTGETARWNHVMPKGYVPGDTAGNAAIMSHVVIAVSLSRGQQRLFLPPWPVPLARDQPGPVGFNPKTFSGPFLTTLAFAVYVVVPQAFLQLYFSAQERDGVRAPRLAAYGLFVMAALTGAGIASVSMILWLPAIR